MYGQWVSGRLTGCFLLGLVVAGRVASASESRVHPFMAHVENSLPALLEETGVPGAAVSIVHDGRIVYSAGFGWADPVAGIAVRPSTRFNVGSLAKTVTAWGVMAAVRDGMLDLQAPVRKLLPDLPLLEGGSASAMTVEQLLAHTGGLSTPSVPEYLPWQRRKSVRSWLASADGDVQVTTTPGEKWSYSGAGYALLQLVIERVAGVRFESYMQRTVFRPLDMRSTGFGHPRPGSEVAAPHAEGRRIPYRRYSGLAAAGLYTTSEDLAKFLAAHSAAAAGPAGRAVVSPEDLARMQRPRPLSLSPYGTSYGLGYAVWPLATGEQSVGHRGQNHGWSAVAWLSPDGRDGLVVLTNDSTGERVYRRIFCDWARWLAGATSFGRYCAKGAQGGEEGTGAASPTVAPAELIRSRVPPDGPGVAALVIRDGEVLVRDAVGLGNLESGTELTPETPFYVASLAKPLTAAVILGLVADGGIALDDPLGELVPGLPGVSPTATVRELLLHTGGVPDFWNLVDWRRRPPGDNQSILEMVESGSAARSRPGAKFDYSNTGYLALALLAERATGKWFRALLSERWPGMPASSRLFVLDTPEADLPQRARGYAVSDGVFYLSDYRRLELPGRVPVEPGFAMVGAGGVVANLDGLHRWARALVAGELLPPPIMELAFVPGPEARGLEGFGGTPRITLAGFLAGEFEGRRLLWQDGALFGHRSILLIEPEADLLVILLANTGGIDLRSLCREILERLD